MDGRRRGKPIARGLGDTQDFEVQANLTRGMQGIVARGTQSSAHAPHPASGKLLEGKPPRLLDIFLTLGAAMRRFVAALEAENVACPEGRRAMGALACAAVVPT